MQFLSNIIRKMPQKNQHFHQSGSLDFCMLFDKSCSYFHISLSLLRPEETIIKCKSNFCCRLLCCHKSCNNLKWRTFVRFRSIIFQVNNLIQSQIPFLLDLLPPRSYRRALTTRSGAWDGSHIPWRVPLKVTGCKLYRCGDKHQNIHAPKEEPSRGTDSKRLKARTGQRKPPCVKNRVRTSKEVQQRVFMELLGSLFSEFLCCNESDET